MKKFILFSAILCTFYSFGQGNQLSVEISKKDFSKIEITGTNYILKTDTQQLYGYDEHYEFLEGKGGKKDNRGVRERNKKYFVTGTNDTLATIILDPSAVIINDKQLAIQSTEDGWAYLDTDNQALCTVNLFWNTNKWIYNLTFNEADETSDTLKKIILLSLVDLAQEASKTDCDNDMETFWFILYASSLGN